MGVCEVLEEADVIASTHRAHAHALAKGTHPNELMAELYGKVEGCSRGYGGSMHLYDIERGNIGADAVVGGGLPAITGAALSFKLRGEPRVAVAFFGDGATNIGTFHESLNLAQLWTVPPSSSARTTATRSRPRRGSSCRSRISRSARLPTGCTRSSRTDRTSRRSTRPRRGRSSTRATARGLCSCSPTRSVSPGTSVGDPQVYRPREEVLELRQTQDPIEKLRAKLEGQPGGVGSKLSARSRSAWRPRSSSRRTAPTRAPKTR